MAVISKAITALPLAYFGLMCLGLLLASYFLYIDKLDGSEWVMMCSILFATDRAAVAAGAFKRENQ